MSGGDFLSNLLEKMRLGGIEPMSVVTVTILVLGIAFFLYYNSTGSWIERRRHPVTLDGMPATGPLPVMFVIFFLFIVWLMFSERLTGEIPDWAESVISRFGP